MEKSDLKSFSLDSLIWFFINLTLFIAPIFLLPYLIASTTFPKFFIFSALTIILLFFILLKVLFEETSFFFSPFFYFLIVLAFVAILTTIFSPHPFTSFWGSYHRSDGLICFLGYLFFAFLMTVFPRSFEQNITLMKTASITGFLVSFLALSQRSGYIIPRFSPVPYRVSSTLGNPNILASFLIFTLPVTLALAIFCWGKERSEQALSFLFFISFGIQLSALYLTYTRAAWVGAVISLLFFVGYLSRLTKKRGKIKEVILWGLVVALAFQILTFSLVFFFLRADSSSFLSFKGKYSEFALTFRKHLIGRLENLPLSWAKKRVIFQQAFKVINERPFIGTGLDSYQYVSARYNLLRKISQKKTLEVSDRPHNDFLQVAANFGVAGFLSYLSLVILTFLVGIKALKKADWPDSLFIASLVSGFFGYIFQNQFSFNSIPTGLYFFAVAGLINGFYKIGRVIEFKTPKFLKREPLPFIATLFLLSALFLLIYRISFVPLLARVAFDRATGYGRAGDYDSAIKEAERATKLMSGQAEYFLALGEAYLEAGKQLNDLDLFDQGLYYLRRAVEVNPYYLFGKLKLGVFLLRAAELTGKPEYVEESIEVLEGLLPFTAKPFEVYYELGVGYYYLKNYDQAEKNLKLALKGLPGEKDVWFLLGKIAEKKNKTKEAIRFYKQSLALWGSERKKIKEKGKEPFWQLENKAEEALRRLKGF